MRADAVDEHAAAVAVVDPVAPWRGEREVTEGYAGQERGTLLEGKSESLEGDSNDEEEVGPGNTLKTSHESVHSGPL